MTEKTKRDADGVTHSKPGTVDQQHTATLVGVGRIQDLGALEVARRAQWQMHAGVDLE